MSELAKKLPTTVAIIALAVIGYAALSRGVNGPLQALVVTAIAGLGGFYLRDLINRREHR